MSRLEIVDAHHHIWRQADQPWLNGPMVPRIFGSYEPIRRDYPIDEFLVDLKDTGVVASVYVQTNWAPARALEEVQWVQSVADNHGWPHAIVGFADMTSATLATDLDAMRQYKHLRGVRQQVHWHENAQYRFASRPDLVADSAWRQGLSLVAQRGLVFELQVFPSQMTLAAEMVKAFPDLTFVLIHAGMLEDRSESGWQLWQHGMKQLADCPNLFVKFSGLGTFLHRAALDDSKPIIDTTVSLFGPERCVWGSNFPIEKLWTSYATLVDIIRRSISHLAVSDQRQILSETAVRLYKLEL